MTKSNKILASIIITVLAVYATLSLVYGVELVTIVVAAVMLPIVVLAPLALDIYDSVTNRV